MHTGYYNNFVYTIPMIRQHIIQPILQANEAYQQQRKSTQSNDPDNTATPPPPPPIKIYVCGASLGAALATLAYCFLLMELPLDDPHFLPVKLLAVTAGSPRVGNHTFRQMIHDRMAILRRMDRAVNCRLVYNQDLVPHLPFGGGLLRFVHLDKLVFITHDGDIIINPKLVLHREGFSEIHHVVETFFKDQTGAALARMPYYSGGLGDLGAGLVGGASGGGCGATPSAESNTSNIPSKHDRRDQDINAAFAKEVKATPGPVRDHMPFWYLTSLENAKAKEDRAYRKPDSQTITNG